MRIALIAILVWGSLVLGIAQNEADALHHIQVDVVYLASDYLEGRETGKSGEEKAADYIVRRMQEIGLKPAGKNGSWYQSFDFTFSPNPHSAEGEARRGKNVLGMIDNGAPTTVVIGAHYDHLGHGFTGSLYTGEPAIHNGADDNASGVAAMLRLADYLYDGNLTQNNYLFLAFSGEELGLYGSKFFTKAPTLELDKINYMINLDMVGRLNEDKELVINGVGTSPAWTPALETIRVGGIQTTTTESGIGASDHTSFYLKDIPALHFFTGLHSDYHKPADDAHLINYPGILEVTDFIIALIEALDDQGELAFTKTKDERPDRKAAAFKVTLGVMPDYTYEGKGMHIDSVIEGRPGQKAGIEDGDVVIQIGEYEVTDIYSYMEALSKFKSGEKAKVVVKRGDEQVETEVTF